MFKYERIGASVVLQCHAFVTGPLLCYGAVLCCHAKAVLQCHGCVTVSVLCYSIAVIKLCCSVKIMLQYNCSVTVICHSVK